jgi:feruloyl-CoA synthase
MSLEAFAPPAVEIDSRVDGSFVLRSPQPLAAYPSSLGTLLAHWARERADRVFLAERAGNTWRTITYAEMYDAVRRVATGLLESGLTTETPIAILSPASLAHATVALAALYVGIPVAPISPAYSTQFGDLRRLAFVLAALQPGMVFAADADAYAAALASVDPGVPLVIAHGKAPQRGARTLAELGARDGGEIVDAAHRAVTPSHVAKILFTSGSTGEPKGVINTHRMLCSNQQSISQAWLFLKNHDLVLVDWLPWHHTFGGNHNFNMVLFHGGTLYIDDGRPMPGHFERSLAALTEHPPTIYFNVPRGHKLLVEALHADPEFATRFFSRLRLIGNAAAALPKTTWDALRELAHRYGKGDVAVTGSWGLTETAPAATAVHYPLQDPTDIGLPLPGTELLFQPFEQKLQVWVRGPLVTPGYWRRDDLTAQAFNNEGFYCTGDAIRFSDPSDPSRGLRFDGRIAENFKLSSGTWVDAGAVRLAVLASAATLLDDVVVAGENHDDIGILVFPNAKARSAHPDAALRATLAAALQAYNAGAGGSSFRVGRAIVVTEPLSLVEGELTDKGSVNQRRVLQRRANLVARLFESQPADDIIIP